MFTIKVGKRKIKLLNWLIFILAIILIIYLFGSLIFLIPVFKKEFNYKIDKENYSIKGKIDFKNAWFKCNVKEVYYLDVKDSLVKNKIYNDLRNDGYKVKKNGKVIRKRKYLGFCKNKIKLYKEIKNNTNFKLNGKSTIKVKYNNTFSDSYVTLDNKNKYKVYVNSNLNEKQIGDYIISYTININELFKERLYRKVSIIDDEKPVIELIGDKEIVINYNDKYKELGYKASDNYDGDITDKVKVKNTINTKKAGIYYVSYTVSDTNGNKTTIKRKVIVNEKTKDVSGENKKIEVIDGITYVNGILIVNKKYGLPKDYNPGANKEALSKLNLMQADAKSIGLNLPLVSGFRSYTTQEALYNKYVKKDGEALASTYSAKPGTSEHQTGLAFDIGIVDSSFANTNEAKWIAENAHLYGFIVRYPKGKTDITGYIYEPWHVRYLGVDIATKVKESGLCLEEYLGIN